MSSDRSGQVWAYDVDAVRELLEAAFEETSLRAFCLDRPAFRPVTYLFSPGDDLTALAGKVTGYCLRTERFDVLLDEVQTIAPAEYEAAKERLIRPGVIDATTPVAPLRRQVGALLEAGAYGQAIWLLRKAQVGRPQSAQLEGLLAESLYGAGVQAYTARQWAEAERALAEVVELDPGYRDVGSLLQQVRARLPAPDPDAPGAPPAGQTGPTARSRSRRRGWPLLVALVLLLLVACAGGLYLLFSSISAPGMGPVAADPTLAGSLPETRSGTADSAESTTGAGEASPVAEGTAATGDLSPTQAPALSSTAPSQGADTPESPPPDTADSAATGTATGEPDAEAASTATAAPVAETPSSSASLTPEASPVATTAAGTTQAASTGTATAVLSTATPLAPATPVAAATSLAAATPSVPARVVPTLAPSGLPTEDTQALSPAATAVLTGTSGPPATWQLLDQRLLGPGEGHQICGDGTAQIRVRVVDALGNPLGGVWLHDAETGGNQATGTVLGETVFTCGVGGWGQLCITGGDNGPCISPSTRELPCWDLPSFEALWAAGYCNCCEVGASKDRCEQLLRQGKCPLPQSFAWQVTFQRTW